MKFALKIGSFFWQGYKSRLKVKMKGMIKNLKLKKFFNDNSKIYLGISLELLRAVWSQFSFG